MNARNAKAIETRYKGYRFRSRLEARWAVFFDALGIEWEYEKEGYDLPSGPYLPDFWLPQVRMWAEVKPEEFTEKQETLCQSLAEQTGFSCLLLVGVPSFREYAAISPEDGWDGGPWRTTYVICTEYLCEHRFFCCNGDSRDPDDYEYFYGYHYAVSAARSARFEHGESSRW
jgi:hypothetical protein